MMDEKLLAECQALRDTYHRWCTLESDAPGYSELCIESTPRVGNDSPSALGMVAEAGRRALTVLLGSANQATLVWDGCIDNAESVVYNIAYVRKEMCKPCPRHGMQLVADDGWHDGFAGAATIYVAHLECGDQFVDDSADVEAAR